MMASSKSNKRAPSATAIGRVEIMLEQLTSTVQSLAESTAAGFEQMNRKIDDLRTELTSRIEVLESVVRQNSADIRKNSEDIAALRLEMDRFRAELNGMRVEVRTLATQTALQQLESRVSKLEARLGVY